MKVSPQKRRKVLELFHAGWTGAGISRVTKVDVHTIERIVQSSTSRVVDDPRRCPECGALVIRMCGDLCMECFLGGTRDST